jgi:hypothetical protein
LRKIVDRTVPEFLHTQQSRRFVALLPSGAVLAGRMRVRNPGINDAELDGLMKAAGFGKTVVRVGARRENDPFTVLIASGERQSLENK